MVNNALAWEMVQAELVNFLSGDPIQFSGLQIVAVPLDALWNNPNWGMWLGFETADNIPVWGPIYKPSVDNQVTSAYLVFITSIDAPAQDNDAANQAKALGPQLSIALDGTKKARKQMSEEWRDFNNGQKDLPLTNQLSFDSWFAQSWEQKIKALEDNYSTLATQWMMAANKAGRGYQTLVQAMLDYNNPDFQTQVVDINGAKQPSRMWNLSPSLADFIQEARANQGTSLSLQIDSHSSTSINTKWGMDASASLDIGFIGIGTGGGFQRTSVDVTFQDFKIAFSAKSFSGIQIMAGQWFHQNVVIQFQNGPFVPNAPTFFGPSGAFNLIISTVYVAYQPSVAATLDATAYPEVKQSWNSGMSVSIGPFIFGGGGSGASDKAIFNDADRSFTFTSNSPHPQIIAVNCNALPNS